MKPRNLALITLMSSIGLVASSYADDAHHPEKAQEAKPAVTAKPATKPTDSPVKAMQANVEKMKKQLDRVAKAKTSAERQDALAEHMMTMAENMRIARSMHSDRKDCPMMGNAGGMGMMGGGHSAADDRIGQLEKRMDMMQMMMEKMMKPGGGDAMPGMGKP